MGRGSISEGRIAGESFKENDYLQFKISDVIDVDKIEIQQLAEGRYRVSAPTKIKYVDGRMYFDDTLWFIFEEHMKRYVVVELD